MVLFNYAYITGKEEAAAATTSTVCTERGGSAISTATTVYFSPRYHNNSTATLAKCDAASCSSSSRNSSMSNGRVVSRLSSSGKVLISVFVLLTNLSVKVATDPVVGGHHGGIIEKQTQLQQHQPTIGATHQQEDEPFLLNEIEEDVHCKYKKCILSFSSFSSASRFVCSLFGSILLYDFTAHLFFYSIFTKWWEANCWTKGKP